MATLTHTASAFGAISAAYHGAVARWRRRVTRRARAAQVWRELDAYTDRELADLGLSRSDIPAIARAAYDAA